MTELTSVPNHHADHAGFSGLYGIAAALSMIVGRDEDARVAARLSGAGPGAAVVDIGCGPGVAARHAVALGAQVTGVDPAPLMLRVARLLTRRSAPVRYIEGVAEALPLADDCTTIAWSIASLHHWADIDAGLCEVRRIVRSGGRFVAIEHRAQSGARGPASHGWTDAQADAFADRCSERGFLDVRVERATTGHRPSVSVVATAP
jgi:ubiquinone/menaquinone biosynthesis C-methylase UbiE